MKHEDIDHTGLTGVGGGVTEYDYVPKTTNTSITATTEATADTIVTGNAVVYDGSTVIWVEFYSPNCRPDSTAATRSLLLWLYDGSSSIGAMGAQGTPAAAADDKAILCRVRITPSAGSHTYSVRATVSAGTGVVSAGAGGVGVYYPTYIRITSG